jgi:hypothetical protein
MEKKGGCKDFRINNYSCGYREFGSRNGYYYYVSDVKIVKAMHNSRLKMYKQAV